MTCVVKEQCNFLVSIKSFHLYPVRVIADCEEDDFVLPIIVSPPVNVESYVEEVVVHQSRFPMEHFEMVLIIRPPAVDTHEDGVQGLCLPWGRRQNKNTRELDKLHRFMS